MHPWHKSYVFFLTTFTCNYLKTNICAETLLNTFLNRRIVTFYITRNLFTKTLYWYNHFTYFHFSFYDNKTYPLHSKTTTINGLLETLWQLWQRLDSSLARFSVSFAIPMCVMCLCRCSIAFCVYELTFMSRHIRTYCTYKQEKVFRLNVDTLVFITFIPLCKNSC
jgi:hypothetical protein